VIDVNGSDAVILCQRTGTARSRVIDHQITLGIAEVIARRIAGSIARAIRIDRAIDPAIDLERSRAALQPSAAR
jgi:hypothetical protein